MSEEKIPVAVYARYSSDMQNAESIEQQFKIIEEYCRLNNFEIVKKYSDSAMSGSIEDRPRFQLMTDDAGKNKFQHIVVYKLDRFSRNTEHFFRYEQLLNKYSVSILSATEHFEDNPAGTLSKTVMVGVNQYHNDNLAKDVMRGLKNNASKNLSTGGKCLGYDVINKKYVINPREAEAVRMIFEMYDQGNGYTAIIKKLNSFGYKTKTKKKDGEGNSFGKNSLNGILRNPKYKGEYVYNAIAHVRKGTPRNSHKHKDESGIIRIPGGVPSIVSVEMFDRIQAKMDKSKYLAGAYTAKNEYLLTGLIYCGECNHAMIGNARSPGKGRDLYISYRCTHRDNTLKCTNVEIKRDDIENFVLTQLKMYLATPNLAETLTEEMNRIIGVKNDEFYSRIKCLKRESEDITDAIKRIAKSIAKGYDDDTFKQEYDNCCSRKEQIKLLLDEMQEQDNGCKGVTVEEVKKDIEKAIAELQNAGFYTLRHIFKQYIERVEISKNEVRVTFKVALALSDSKAAKYTFSRIWDRDMLKNYVA